MASRIFLFFTSLSLFFLHSQVTIQEMQEPALSTEYIGSGLTSAPMQEPLPSPEIDLSRAADQNAYTGEAVSINKEEEKLKENFEISNREDKISNNSLTVKDIEAQMSTVEDTMLPHSKLIPLMFGLCAGMLLSSMDSVSKS
jgi:hypothetical protein